MLRPTIAPDTDSGHILKAALWMVGSIASFSLMAVAGREVSSDLDTFEIMMYRSIVGVIIVCALAAATGAWRSIKTDRLGMHLVRNACLLYTSPSPRDRG